jgi:hypothetical protein
MKMKAAAFFIAGTLFKSPLITASDISFRAIHRIAFVPIFFIQLTATLDRNPNLGSGAVRAI